MKKKKITTYSGLILLLLVAVISVFIFVIKEPIAEEYIYLNSASLSTCEAKESSLESQGWVCYGCNDGDNNGKYSLYCDPPEDECNDGQTKCEDNHYIVCISKDNGNTWADLGIREGKCGVDCVNDNDCLSYESCSSNYECVGEKPIDPCDGVTCADSCSNNNWKTNGYCDDGNCRYDIITCENNEICNINTGCEFKGECMSDMDCSEGTLCVDSMCKPIEGYCFSDSDCSSDEFCSETNNQCVEQSDSPVEEPTDDKIEISLVPIIIIIVLLIVIVMIFVMRRKK